MKRIINEKRPTHWTLTTLSDKGFAFAADDQGNGGFLPAAVVSKVGITADDLARGFRAYFLATPGNTAQTKNDDYPQITLPIWWDSDQAEAVGGHLPPVIRDEVVALLQRIDDDLDHIYELTGLDAESGD